MSICGNFYERANPAPVADAWCVYEIDSSGSGDTDQNPKILDGYGISRVERIQSGVHRVYFTNPEKVSSGGYVVMCGSELGNAPSGYGIAMVHGTTADSSSIASGASGSFDLSILGFNAGSSSAPSTLTDSSYTVRNRVNLAVFCLRSDSDLNKTAVSNEIRWSETFSNAVWTKFGGATILADTIPAPYGTGNASELIEGTLNATNQKGVYNTQDRAYDPKDKVFTGTVYVKAKTRFRGRFIVTNATNIYFGVNFNLNTLSLGSIGVLATLLSSSIQSVGDGWYRITVTGKFTSSPTSNRIGLYINTAEDSAGNLIYVGENKSFYIWGAQLEEGSVATNYIKTEATVPVYGNQDLLLRPAARGNGFGQMTYQNLLTNTETPAGWAKSNVGISAGYTAPDGTTTAFKIWEYETLVNIRKYAYLGQGIQNFGHTAGGHRPTTFSFYAKADERRYVSVIDSNSANYGKLVVDLQDGKVVRNTAALDVDVYPAGGGWWRISVAAPRRSGLVSNRFVNVAGIAPAVDPTSPDGVLGDDYGARHPGVSFSGILVWHGQINHGTVYGDYARSGAAIVGTTFSRVLGATYESVARVLPSGGAATAWGTIVVPRGTASSTVSAYLENSYGVQSVSASSNNTFDVAFSSSMSTDTYCVVTSIETETVHLPESGVGTAGSIPPTDEFVLPIMRSSGTVDAQRKLSGFTLRCLRQDPITNAFTEQSIHHQRGREFKIHFMVFGGKLTYGAG